MAEIEQRSVCEGVGFRSLRSDRYKTLLISVSFFLPMKRETASVHAILPYLLARASRRYPDFTKLNQRLAELYGAVLDAAVRKCGDAQLLTVSVSAIADRYALDGEKLSSELSRLLCSVCLDPPLENGCFPQDGFLQEKRQLLETLDSEFSDKVTYALLRCEEAMCAGEPFGVGRIGTRETIEALDPAQLVPAWEKIIRRSRVEILVLGDCDPEPVFRDFSEAFRALGRGPAEPIPTVVIRSAQNRKDVSEQLDVAQAKLVLGFRTGSAEPESEEAAAARLMCAIYGGSPTSRLFLNVREKMSLCYYCSSMFHSMKGIMEVQSGVEQENLESAEREILAQLETMRRGEFTDDEIADAKRYLMNAYGSFSDSIDSLEGWYLSRTLCSPLRSPDEEAAMVASVTREQITEAARRVTLDTVYRLTGNGGTAHE